jgi:hypothetical protein
VYTVGSKNDERVAWAVITPEWKTRKWMRPQITVYSAEQVAIREILIDSLSSLMAIEGDDGR